MIIVTQNKKRIVNFSQIKDLFVAGYAAKNGEFDYKVRANVSTDKEHVLGRYLSEDTAMRVLGEITKAYVSDMVVFYMPPDEDEKGAERWRR